MKRVCWLLFCCLTWGLVTAVMCGTHSRAWATPATVELEAVLQTFQPLQPRTENEQDRVLAAAQYSLGRIQFQRERPNRALHHYQRAFRYDPQAVSVLREIVPLTLKLKRHDEAARYALVAAANLSGDPLLMRQLAIFLTEKKKFRSALALYENVSKSEEQSEPDATRVLVRLEMGRLYFLTGQFDKSAQAFEVVRGALNDPDRFGLTDQLRKILLGRAHVTYTLMAESYLADDRTQQAVSFFQKAEQSKTNKPLLILQLARVKAHEGQFEQALEGLQEYFDAKPSVASGQPYRLLADWVEQVEADRQIATRRVIDLLAELYKEDKSNTDLAYVLAEQYLSAELWEDAARTFSEALEIRPETMGYRGLATVLLQQRDFPALLDLIAKAVGVVGSLNVFGDQVKAIAADEEVVTHLMELAQDRLANEDGEGHEQIAMAASSLAIRAGRYDQVDPFMDVVIRSDSPVRSLIIIGWGLEYLATGQYERSTQVFQRAIDDKSLPDETAVLHYYLASALELDGQTDRAVAAARAAVAERSDQPQFRSRVAWILYHAKRYREATEAYQQLIADFDKDYSSMVVRETLRDARSILSNICVMEKRFTEAEEWLEQILDEFPRDVGALNDLGYLYADQDKRLERSLRMITRAVEEEPENTAYMDSMGWVLYRLERYDDAVKYLEKATAGGRPDGVILDHLGDVYLRIDHRKKALEAWGAATESIEPGNQQELLQEIQVKIQRYASP